MQENTGSGYPGDAEVTDDFGLAGVPDAFQRLWTPHRMAYIKGGQHQFKNRTTARSASRPRAPMRSRSSCTAGARATWC